MLRPARGTARVLGVALMVAVLLGVGLPANAAAWNGRITSFTTSAETVSGSNSLATLTMGINSPLAGTPYQMAIYDNTTHRKLRGCGDPYNYGCDIEARIPFGETRTFTAYVASNTPEEGTPTGVADSTVVTVRHTGWPGKITSFTTSAKTVNSSNPLATLTMGIDSPLAGTPYKLAIYNTTTHRRLWSCSDSYNYSCDIEARVPFGETHTFTAYVASDTPSEGTPTGVADSAVVTVRHTGWPGKITSFTATTDSDGVTTASMSVDSPMANTPLRMAIYDNEKHLIATCGDPYNYGCTGSIRLNSDATRWFRGYVTETAPFGGLPTTGIAAASASVAVTGIAPADLSSSAVVATLTQKLVSRFPADGEACLVLGEKVRAKQGRTSSVSDVTLVCNALGVPRALQLIIDTAGTAAAVGAVDALTALIQGVEDDAPTTFNPDCDHVSTNGDCLDDDSPDTTPSPTPQPDPAGAGGRILPPSSCLTAAEKAALMASMNPQIHHVAPWQHKAWTPQYKQIADKYGLDLDDSWNKIQIKHAGPHPKEYHQWVLTNMERADIQANGDATVFKALFKEWITDVVNNDPTIVRLSYWKCYRNKP